MKRISEHEIYIATNVLRQRIEYLREHEPHACNEISNLKRALVAIQSVPLEQFKGLEEDYIDQLKELTVSR